MQLNLEKLTAIVEAAKAKTSDSRWIRAIDKAFEQLTTNPYIDLDKEHEGGLIILGTRGNIYSSNGVCQCESFTYGQKPCWHRAAARLVKRYQEAEQSAPARKQWFCGDRDLQHLAPREERDKAVMIKPEGKSLKIGAYDV